MKTMRILTSVMALLGISGCAGFKTVPVKEFERLAADGNVQLVDVRTLRNLKKGILLVQSILTGRTVLSSAMRKRPWTNPRSSPSIAGAGKGVPKRQPH